MTLKTCVINGCWKFCFALQELIVFWNVWKWNRTVILNCNNISQYQCFCFIDDQINAALVWVTDFSQLCIFLKIPPEILKNLHVICEVFFVLFVFFTQHLTQCFLRSKNYKIACKFCNIQSLVIIKSLFTHNPALQRANNLKTTVTGSLSPSHSQPVQWSNCSFKLVLFDKLLVRFINWTDSFTTQWSVCNS